LKPHYSDNRKTAIGGDLMSAEFWGSHTTDSDFITTLTISGDPEQVRTRLAEAVERLGYQIVSENPLHAKRGAQGGARWDCSFEVLDYPTILTIGVKALNDLTSAAVFNYEIKAYKKMSKGDEQTLQREAEAIVALATQKPATCPQCYFAVTDDSRFCRRCGTPLVADLPELEVLRLTRETRAGFNAVVLGTLTLLLALALIVLLFWVTGPKLYRALMLIASLIAAFGGYCLGGGLWDLYRTLNPKRKSDEQLLPGGGAPGAPKTLPPVPTMISITEGTTELLNSEGRLREEVPRRKPVDTAEVKDQKVL
jgi:hypothetical protein